MTVGIYPKEKGQTVYYVNSVNYRFSLPLLDKKGEKRVKKHPATGRELETPDGTPEYIEFPVVFTPWKTRFTEDGYWSVYVVDKNTPKQIAEELKKDAEDRTTKILTEEAFLKQTNPDLAARIKEDTKKDATIAKQSEELEELKAKLAALGGNKEK